MRDPERIDRIIELLRAVWKRNPDLRLCQMISNLTGGDPFYNEDDDLEKKLKELLRKYRNDT